MPWMNIEYKKTLGGGGGGGVWGVGKVNHDGVSIQVHEGGEEGASSCR